MPPGLCGEVQTEI